MHFETFDRLTEQGRRWFFTIVAVNGEPVAQSEAYKSAQSRGKGIASIKRGASVAPVTARGRKP